MSGCASDDVTGHERYKWHSEHYASIFMLETEHRFNRDIKGEKGFFGNPD